MWLANSVSDFYERQREANEMSDDVKKVAELLLDYPLWRIHYESDQRVQVNWKDVTSLLLAEAQKVARAYLAEHPADDAEEITAEWLAAVGFKYEEDNDSFTLEFTSCSGIQSQATIEFESAIWFGMSTDYNENMLEYHTRIAELKTRSNLRGLAKYLGIKLKE
jgi:hypothetical protein